MLTKKQFDLLEFIHQRVQSVGVPPSFDEMKDALDLRSKSGIHRLITALEERGFIRRLAHRARALEIVKLPDTMQGKIRFTPRTIDGDRPNSKPVSAIASETASIELPVMGRIAAGTPIAAISEVSHNISVPQTMLGKGMHYALEVRGDSMIEAGINDGDIVVIRETKNANNGDIVVALVEDQEATLKRFRQAGRTITLEPANATLTNQLYRDDQVKVQGRLVGLIRTYS